MTARLLGADYDHADSDLQGGFDAVSAILRALHLGGDTDISQELKQRLSVDGAVWEHEVLGGADTFVLLHGALLSEAYAPLCAEPAVAARYWLVRHHRRGDGGSSHVPAPFSIGRQAADCRAPLRG